MEVPGKVKRIWAKYERILVVTEENRLFVGETDFLSLELFEFTEVKHSIDCIEDIKMGFTFALIVDGAREIYGLGNNTYGEMGMYERVHAEEPVHLEIFSAMKDQIKDIDVGYRHTIITKTDGRVFVCGDNSEGQCTGQTDTVSELIQAEFRSKNKVQLVDAYGNFSFFIDENHTLTCCGTLEKFRVGANTKKISLRVPSDVFLMTCRYVTNILSCNSFSIVECSKNPRNI